MATGFVLHRPRLEAVAVAERVRPLNALMVAAVTTLAAVLRFAGFGAVSPNPFYDAAVRSMGMSWHNLFYGAFEPAGQVSVDKIPADLWLQVASVKLFGFSSVALRMPEALASTAAVPLLYGVVRALFGHAAGVAAAVALAVLPVSVLTGRSDTMDSMMMAVLVAASWLVATGGRRGRGALVVAGGAVAGIAFNVKLFEALVAVTALALLALLLVDGSARRRALVLGTTAVAFLLSSASWLLAGSLLPGAHRPWPIGSTDGSAWSVVFGFNGIDRLRGNAVARSGIAPPGLLRLMRSGTEHFGALVGAMLVAALVLGALALLEARIPSACSRPPAQRKLRRAGAVWIGAWLVTGAALLSAMHTVHARYLEAFTPAIAAAAGVGVVTLAAAASRRPRAGVALAGGAGLTAAVASGIGGAPSWGTVLAVTGAAATACVAVAIVRRRGGAGRPLGAALGVAALVAVLGVPLAGSVQVASSRLADSGYAGAMRPAQLAALSHYLRAHQGSARYQAASSTVVRVGALIARDGRPVLMLTSLHGRPLLSAMRLAGLVRGGQVGYVLLGAGACAKRAAVCAPVMRWAHEHTVDVSLRAGLGRSGILWRLTPARVR